MEITDAPIMMIYKPEYVNLAIFLHMVPVAEKELLNINKSLRQIRILLLALLFLVLTLSSPFCVMDLPAEIETSLTVSQGIRVDNFDWNIAGNIYGTDPNILSELTWSDITIIQTKAHGRLTITDKFYVKYSLGYGRIIDGDNQDSDYDGYNRTDEYSRSNNSADDGNVMDISAGLGYQLRPKSDRFAITPLIGLSYHEQNFIMTDGYQTIDESDGLIGPFPGLNSKYDARWMGPWLGVDLSLKIINKVNLSGAIELHLADYEGVGDWNLREKWQHPKSFEHFANGYGMLIAAAIDYIFNEHWNIGIITSYQDWSTHRGISRTYLSNGVVLGTRFNEANWNSLTAEAGITYRF